ncbi:MAG: hypothetical protein WBD05_00420 [Phycisphaerae bacterium]
MAVCDVCKKRFRLKRLRRRLAVPEYRSMIGIWPWLAVRVCDGCVETHDRDFLERLRLLAPDVLRNDEPIVRQVCLVCGAVRSPGGWHAASKWLDGDGRPTRRARFHLCSEHRDAVYIDGIVVSSNLTGADRVGEVVDELPTAGADLLERVEGWRPGEAGCGGPADACDFSAGLARDQAVARAWRFWREAPEGLEAKAVRLGPVRKDYKMRYRLDLVRDFSDGRRETLVVVRTAPDAFASYR